MEVSMRIAIKKSLQVLAAGLAAQGVSPAQTLQKIATALLAAAAIALSFAATSASAQQVPFVVTTCRDIAGGDLGCQWQIENFEGVPLEPFDLTNFPPQESSVFGHAPGTFPSEPLVITSNGFFSASQYASDCSQPILFVNQQAIINPISGATVRPATQLPLCTVTAAPEVDQSFLSQLQAAGLFFKVVYPIQDNGNGHAYVVWTNSEQIHHPFLNLPSVAGYARITGTTWQNQFQTVSGEVHVGTINDGQLESVTIPFGDNLGMVVNNLGMGTLINSLASPARETTIRLAIPALTTTTAGADTNGFVFTVLTDAWLAETTPPVPPPSLTPPVASTQTPKAGAINIGSASTGAGSGTGSGGTGFSVTDTGFNWAAYCNSPDSLGNMRSPLWVQSCLAAELP
jgi:hypothetical protein